MCPLLYSHPSTIPLLSWPGILQITSELVSYDYHNLNVLFCFLIVKCIILQIWRSEIQNDFTGLKPKCWQAVLLPERLPGGECVSFLFQFLRGHLHSSASGPCSHLQISGAGSTLPLASSSASLFHVDGPLTALGPARCDHFISASAD